MQVCNQWERAAKLVFNDLNSWLDASDFSRINDFHTVITIIINLHCYICMSMSSNDITDYIKQGWIDNRANRMKILFVSCLYESYDDLKSNEGSMQPIEGLKKVNTCESLSRSSHVKAAS